MYFRISSTQMIQIIKVTANFCYIQIKRRKSYDSISLIENNDSKLCGNILNEGLN